MVKFVVGEIAVFVPIGEGPESLYRRSGDEVEVVLPLGMYDFNFEDMHHVIKFSDGRRANVTPDCLRKKKPPHEPSTWKEVEKATRGWNPTKQGVSCG